MPDGADDRSTDPEGEAHRLARNPEHADGLKPDKMPTATAVRPVATAAGASPTRPRRRTTARVRRKRLITRPSDPKPASRRGGDGRISRALEECRHGPRHHRPAPRRSHRPRRERATGEPHERSARRLRRAQGAVAAPFRDPSQGRDRAEGEGRRRTRTGPVREHVPERERGGFDGGMRTAETLLTTRGQWSAVQRRDLDGNRLPRMAMTTGSGLDLPIGAEGAILAHRRMIEALFAAIADAAVDREALVAAVERRIGPPDGQEDPARCRIARSPSRRRRRRRSRARSGRSATMSALRDRDGSCGLAMRISRVSTLPCPI